MLHEASSSELSHFERDEIGLKPPKADACETASQPPKHGSESPHFEAKFKVAKRLLHWAAAAQPECAQLWSRVEPWAIQASELASASAPSSPFLHHHHPPPHHQRQCGSASLAPRSCRSPSPSRHRHRRTPAPRPRSRPLQTDTPSALPRRPALHQPRLPSSARKSPNSSQTRSHPPSPSTPSPSALQASRYPPCCPPTSQPHTTTSHRSPRPRPTCSHTTPSPSLAPRSTCAHAAFRARIRTPWPSPRRLQATTTLPAAHRDSTASTSTAIVPVERRHQVTLPSRRAHPRELRPGTSSRPPRFLLGRHRSALPRSRGSGIRQEQGVADGTALLPRSAGKPRTTTLRSTSSPRSTQRASATRQRIGHLYRAVR